MKCQCGADKFVIESGSIVCADCGRRYNVTTKPSVGDFNKDSSKYVVPPVMAWKKPATK